MLTKSIYILISLIIAAITILLVATRRQTKRLFTNKYERRVYLIVSGLIALNIPVFVIISQFNLDINNAIIFLLISVNIYLAFLVLDILTHIILTIHKHIKSKR